MDQKKIILLGPTTNDRSLSMKIYASYLFATLKTVDDQTKFDLVSFETTNLPILKDILGKEFSYPNYVSELKADLFHITDHSYGSLAFGLGSRNIIATVHDLNALELANQSSFLGKLRFKYNLGGLQKCTRLIADSEFTKKLIQKHLNYQRPIDVVYLGKDDCFRKYNTQQKSLTTQKYQINPKNKYLLHVGHSGPVKNVELILQTLKILPEKYLLVKIGGFTPTQKKFIEDNQLHSRINQYQNASIETLTDWYNLADCLVFPSLLEGFGLPVLEAMACGLPVICSKTASLPEIGGKAVVYIDPHQKRDLFKAITNLTNNKVLSQKLSELGLKQAKKFTWQNCAQETAKVYTKVLNLVQQQKVQTITHSTIINQIEIPVRILDIGGLLDMEYAGYGEVLNFCTKIRPYKLRKSFQGLVFKTKIDSIKNKFGTIKISVNGKIEVSEKIERIITGQFDHTNLFLASAYQIDQKKLEFKNFSLSIKNNIPRGASMGVSAALSIGTIKSLQPKINNKIAAYKALDAETKTMGGISGTQDQFAASLMGSCNLITIDKFPQTSIKKVKLNQNFKKELENNLITVYIEAHSSYATHNKVIAELKKNSHKSDGLDKLRPLVQLAKKAILGDNLAELGRIMILNTQAQKSLFSGIVSSKASALIKIAQLHNAIGWKINGAGGTGGTVSFLFSQRRDLLSFYNQAKENKTLKFFEHQLI